MRRSGRSRGRIRFVIAALLLLSAVLIPFPRNLPLAEAGSGPTLSAFGTATVDGIISPGEYGSCIGPTQVVPVQVNPYFQFPPYTVRFCETNDLTNDYYAVEVSSDFIDPQYKGVTIIFDNNDDGLVPACGGVQVQAEDTLGLSAAGTFVDTWYCSIGVPSYGVHDAHQDGAGVVATGGLGYVFELSHPLASGDLAGFDYQLNPGDTVGWCIKYGIGASGDYFDFPSGCTSFGVSNSAAAFGSIVKVAPPHTLTTYTDTGTTTGTTLVTSNIPTTGTTTTTELLPFGATSTVTSTSASTTTVTIQADALTSTTTTSTGELPVTSTTTVTVTSTTLSCNAVGGVVVCTTLTWTNSTTVTFFDKSTETVTVTQLIRTPTTFTNTVTMSTVVTSTFIATGQYTTTITTTYTSPIATTQTSTSTGTYTTTITTIDTSSSGGGGPPFPGFPVESILMGIILGAAVLVLLRRRRRPTVLE